MSHTDIQTIVLSWEASGTSELAPPASDAEIRKAEQRLGRTLPGECVALYRLCNGGYVLNGVVTLYPLDGPERSLVRAADYFRRYDEPVPPETVVFGGNGRGGFFGFWQMHDGTTQVIEGDGNGSLTVVGTSLARFLRGRSAYYLIADGVDTALDLLEVPAHLRAFETLGDAEYEAVMVWADHTLPEARKSSELF